MEIRARPPAAALAMAAALLHSRLIEGMRLTALPPVLLAALLGLGAFVSSCGEEAAVPDAPRVLSSSGVRAVEPALIAPWVERLDAARVIPLEIPAEIEPWHMESGRADLAIDPDGTRKLVLTAKGGRKLVVPGRFDPREFTQLVLNVNAPRGFRVIAGLDGGAGSAVVSEMVFAEPSRDTQRVAVGFRGLRARSEPFERLVLHFPGDDFLALVGGVELVDVSLSQVYAEEAQDLRPVAIGGDLRHGLVLLAGAPVVARVTPRPGEILRFSYGLPARPRLPVGGELVLRLRIEGADALVDNPYAIDADAERLGWHSAEFPMAAFTGGETELRFELELPDGADAACALAELRLVEPLADPPTVLLITSDTHRADHIGIANSGVPVLTPGLDELAERGVWFADCFSSANVTNPSHIALMTGTHPRDTGVFGNRTSLAREAPTLADHFKAAGYRTFAAISVRHLGHPTSGLGHGFDRTVHPSSEFSADQSVSTMESWFAESSDEPVFAWLHVFDAHWPYEPSPEDLARHWPEDRDAFDEAAPPLDVPAGVLPGRLHGLSDFEYPRALYRAEISALDRELARFLSSERMRAGVIALTADHGEELDTHGIYYGHAGLYTDTIHVPLILAWPGAPTGRRVTTPVRQIDLGRTLLDLAGLSAVDFPGHSLLPVVEGDATPVAARYAIAAGRTAASISTPSWHLIFHLRAEKPLGTTVEYELHQVELFDLQRDPACLEDLVEREPDRARRLRDRLVEWLADARLREWVGGVSDDAELGRHLLELGYTDDGAMDASELLDPDCDCDWCTKLR